MTERAYNFSAGPATLPTEVLEASAQAIGDYQGCGIGDGVRTDVADPDNDEVRCN